MEVYAQLRATILANLEISRSTCIESGAPEKAVRVKPKVRSQLLKDVNWHDLQNIRSRKISAVKCGSHYEKESPGNVTDHKKAYQPFLWDQQPFHIDIDTGCIQKSLPKEHSKTIYCVTTGKKLPRGSYYRLQLPSFKDTAQGAEFVIKNQSNDFIELCSQDRRVAVPRCTQWLGKGEAIMLRRTETQWEFAGKAEGHRSNQVATNPLLRESGPVVLCKQGIINYENDGEYFLTRPVIDHTLRKKLAKLEGNFQYNYCASPEAFEASLKTAENVPCYFVYDNTENNHVTAGCVRVSGDDVHCYLHETLGEESSHTKPLVKLIRDKIATAFPGKRISILLPKERIQRDYASCGVMAIKAISYLAKHPEWLNTLFEQSKSVDGNKGFDTINVHELPARIVKLCQERELIFGHPEQSEMVNSQQTLGEYLSLNETKAVKEGSGLKKRVNAAAHIKRYKYLIGYIKDHAKNRVAETDVITEHGSCRKRRISEPSGPLNKKQVLDKSEIDESKPLLLEEEHLSVLQEHDYSAFRPRIQSQSSRESSGYGSS